MLESLTSSQWNWLETAVWAVGILSVAALVTVATWFLVSRSRRRGLSAPLSEITPPESLEELVPDSRFVSVGDVNLHYVQAGDDVGGDLVLLHGIGASVFIWRFLFPVLQLRHRVTAFDFAGFGKSSKDAKAGYGLDAQSQSIADALTLLGIEKATLIGSSMGGAIGLWMAKRWPDRFQTVIALGPATDSSRVPGVAQFFAATAPLFRYTVNRRTIKLILGYVVSNRQLITDKVVDQYLEPFRDRGESLRAFMAATSVLSDRRLPDSLARLQARALIVWGEHDFMVPRRSMTKLRRVLPSAEFIDHPTGGHHIMEDEPVWLARQIELFLAKKS